VGSGAEVGKSDDIKSVNNIFGSPVFQLEKRLGGRTVGLTVKKG
jgi:hypothetical protein